MKFVGACVGLISKPVGIKGQVKIHPYTSTPDTLLSFKNFYFSDGVEVVFDRPSIRDTEIVTWIVGCKNRNDAELLRLKNIFIKKEDLPKLEENEYYLEDLAGLVVFNQNNIEIGKINAALDYGAGVFMDIKLIETGRVATIPFHKESILDVNLNDKKIIVNDNFILR